MPGIDGVEPGSGSKVPLILGGVAAVALVAVVAVLVAGMGGGGPAQPATIPNADTSNTTAGGGSGDVDNEPDNEPNGDGDGDSDSDANNDPVVGSHLTKESWSTTLDALLDEHEDAQLAGALDELTAEYEKQLRGLLDRLDELEKHSRRLAVIRSERNRLITARDYIEVYVRDYWVNRVRVRAEAAASRFEFLEALGIVDNALNGEDPELLDPEALANPHLDRIRRDLDDLAEELADRRAEWDALDAGSRELLIAWLDAKSEFTADVIAAMEDDLPALRAATARLAGVFVEGARAPDGFADAWLLVCGLAADAIDKRGREVLFGARFDEDRIRDWHEQADWFLDANVGDTPIDVTAHVTRVEMMEVAIRYVSDPTVDIEDALAEARDEELDQNRINGTFSVTWQIDQIEVVGLLSRSVMSGLEEIRDEVERSLFEQLRELVQEEPATQPAEQLNAWCEVYLDAFEDGAYATRVELWMEDLDIREEDGLHWFARMLVRQTRPSDMADEEGYGNVSWAWDSQFDHATKMMEWLDENRGLPRDHPVRAAIGNMLGSVYVDVTTDARGPLARIPGVARYLIARTDRLLDEVLTPTHDQQDLRRALLGVRTELQRYARGD